MERKEMVKELNALTREVKDLRVKLEKLEAHEGDDGTKEDIDGQVSLQDVIAAKRQRMIELDKLVYPK
jgi:predicted helicase